MRYINFHTHYPPADTKPEIAIVSCVAPEPLQQCPPGIWLSYGIHPWYILHSNMTNLIEKVKTLAHNQQVIAIGEAGLDKLRGPAMDIQRQIFCQQIDISETTQKPLIIHSVKANNEILSLRKKRKPLQPWIIHGFNGPPQEMEQLIKEDFYLSFGPRIFYSDSKAANSLKAIPSDRFFLETDHTNKSISALYLRAAEIRGISTQELEEIIENNFRRLFGNIIE